MPGFAFKKLIGAPPAMIGIAPASVRDRLRLLPPQLASDAAHRVHRTGKLRSNKNDVRPMS
jgi:hypothetical protein